MSRHESNAEAGSEEETERLWERVRSVTLSLTDDVEDETDEGAGEGPPLEELVSVDQPFSREKVLARTGMTPEECVLELVGARDGRMQQSAIVEVTGWSPATVSRILSEMEERGDVIRFRLGPGKVVFLPDDAPDGIRP